MTKKLEELFNLDSAEPEKVEPEVPTHEQINSLDESFKQYKKLQLAFRHTNPPSTTSNQ